MLRSSSVVGRRRDFSATAAAERVSVETPTKIHSVTNDLRQIFTSAGTGKTSLRYFLELGIFLSLIDCIKLYFCAITSPLNKLVCYLVRKCRVAKWKTWILFREPLFFFLFRYSYLEFSSGRTVRYQIFLFSTADISFGGSRSLCV